MPRGDCEGVGGTTRQPCCRRRGGGGGALVEPAALAALLSAGGYGYDLRRTIMERTLSLIHISRPNGFAWDGRQCWQGPQEEE